MFEINTKLISLTFYPKKSLRPVYTDSDTTIYRKTESTQGGI